MGKIKTTLKLQESVLNVLGIIGTVLALVGMSIIVIRILPKFDR